MRKILKTVLLLSIVCTSAIILSGCTVSEEKINEYNMIVTDAEKLIESREYTLAIDKLSTAVDLIPSKVEALEKIVDIFILKNRLEDATKLVDESGSHLEDSDRATLYTSIGNAQYEVGNYERALYNYQLAKGMDSGNKEAIFGMGKTYIQKGNIENAKSMLKENFSGDMLIESNLLLSYIEAINDSEKAKSIVKDIEPGDEWREVYTEWNSVLANLDTDVLFNGTKLGKHYIDAGYPYLAVALLEPNIENMGEYIDGIYILGKAYYEHGEYDKSIQLLENSTSLSDLNQYIYWVLARDYYLKDDINNSLSYYDSSISYGGNELDTNLFTEYIDILLKENLTEKALEVMRVAERILEKQLTNMYYMNIYSLRNDTEKFEYYMDLISYDELDLEDKKEYLYSKGEYLIKNSELEEAQKTLDIFWELDEFSPTYNLLSARLSFEKGNLDEARDFAKKAIEYDLSGVVSEDAQKLLAQIN